MKSPIIVAQLSLAVASTLFFASASSPVRAEGSGGTTLARVEGVLADGSVETLTVRPVAGDPVVLAFDANTRFHISLDGDDFIPPGKPVSPPSGDAAPPPGDPTGAPPEAGEPPLDLKTFVGLYARATGNNGVATEVWLKPPFPLHAGGVVGGLSNTGFTLTGEAGKVAGFTVKDETKLFLDGRPVKLAQLANGDRAEVLFYLTPDAAPDGNVALFIRARMAPPKNFEGTTALVPAVQTAAPPADQFAATNPHVTQPLVFKVTSQTAIRINGKPATVADLTLGCPVSVLYRSRGDVNWALRVSVRKLNPNDGKTKGKGDKGKTHTGNANKGKNEKGDKGKGYKGNHGKGKNDTGKGKGDKVKGPGDGGQHNPPADQPGSGSTTPPPPTPPAPGTGGDAGQNPPPPAPGDPPQPPSGPHEI